ncbi:hypothetical protein Halxa_4210 [Halopiger xanaduensis SH-6]|uniref:Uncharacterized protein n=2 Tax=Halopiger xanaduensis TaxID=387343 RepID=F8D5H6_HALXS|nr:hypothetical protein Halxa_4210 [Halopiger xanaduensis SH-6]
MLLGIAISCYGVLLVPVSLLGGIWIAAGGLALLCAGLVATAWVGDRLALSPVTQRRLSIGCTALAVVLLGSFVAINGATFESGVIESAS